MMHSGTRIPGTTAAIVLVIIGYTVLAISAGLTAWGVTRAAAWVARALLGG
jgi:hypothetical protein